MNPPWQRVLPLLDPAKSVFTARPATLSAYRAMLKDVDGLDHAMLARYGLESHVISANTKKQDFHAKFFIGRGVETCEVLSGSANLVTGPSIDNLSFRQMSAAACGTKYLERLNVALPDMPPQQADPSPAAQARPATHSAP